MIEHWRITWFDVTGTGKRVMGNILRCRTCHSWYSVTGVIPGVCPTCQQETTWTTEPAPVKTWLTRNDVLFLKSLRIQPFDPNEE